MSDDTIELIRAANPIPVDMPALPMEPLVLWLKTPDDRRPRRLRARRPGVLAGVLVTAVAIAVIVVAAISGGHRPAPTPATLPQPPIPAGARSLTSILGVLRRPQTVIDRDPAVLARLRQAEHDQEDLGLQGRPVISLLRLATTTSWGEKVYVVPFLAPTATAKRALPKKLRGTYIPATAVLHAFPPIGFGSRAEIEGGRDFSDPIDAPARIAGPAHDRFVMIVPDGVAKVALWPAVNSAANHPRHPVAPGSKPVVVAVHDNVAAFTSRRNPGRELWYDAAGRIVKRIDNASSCGPPLGSCM